MLDQNHFIWVSSHREIFRPRIQTLNLNINVWVFFPLDSFPNPNRSGLKLWTSHRVNSTFVFFLYCFFFSPSFLSDQTVQPSHTDDLPTYFALYWLGSLHSEPPLRSEPVEPPLTCCTGENPLVHSANSVGDTVDISLIKHALGIPSLCAFRQGITIEQDGGGMGGWGEELWISFIVHHCGVVVVVEVRGVRGGAGVLPWT